MFWCGSWILLLWKVRGTSKFFNPLVLEPAPLLDCLWLVLYVPPSVCPHAPVWTLKKCCAIISPGKVVPVQLILALYIAASVHRKTSYLRGLCRTPYPQSSATPPRGWCSASLNWFSELVFLWLLVVWFGVCWWLDFLFVCCFFFFFVLNIAQNILCFPGTHTPCSATVRFFVNLHL